MPVIDQDSLAAIQPELMPEESVLWAGRPDPSIVFHWNGDEPLLGFSLIWGGFAIVWEMAALWSFTPSHPGRSILLILWGVPFVVTGQYMIWGRFLRDAWKKRRTFYAVTDRRVIVVQNTAERQVACAEIDSLATLVKEKGSGEVGTIRFVPAPQLYARTFSEMMMSDRFECWDAVSIKRGPVFVDLPDVDSVYQLISALQARTTEAEVSRILQDRH